MYVTNRSRELVFEEEKISTLPQTSLMVSTQDLWVGQQYARPGGCYNRHTIGKLRDSTRSSRMKERLAPVVVRQ